jgi:hypothetical protein
VRLEFSVARHRRMLRIGAAAAASAILASAIHPYGSAKDPPEQKQSWQVSIDGSAAAVFSRSCVSCHSNQTIWPWYSFVPPASWMIERDVEKGRSRFNLSSWSSYSREKKRETLADIARVAANREMPVRQYLVFHREARLSDHDVQTLISWAALQRRALRTGEREEAGREL